MRRFVGLMATLAVVGCGSESDNEVGSVEDRLVVSPSKKEISPSLRRPEYRMGTLTVRVSPESASYQVRDVFTGTVVVRERAGSDIFRLPLGTYGVAFRPIAGYVVPPGELVVVLSSMRSSDSVAVEYAPVLADAGVEKSNAERQYGIRTLDADHFEVTREDGEKAFGGFGDLNAPFMQVRIVPAFVDGQPIGFKLFSIGPDSIYSAFGIRNGDVLRRINGYDTNSPEKVLEACMKARGSSRIDVQFDRMGEKVFKTIYVLH